MRWVNRHTSKPSCLTFSISAICESIFDLYSARDIQAATTEEPVVGTGMAGVLNLLRQQGALKKQSEEDAEREKIQKQRDLWLADYRHRQAQRELERIAASPNSSW
jgi:aspartate-semialdehyde dehydrogenase